MKFLVDMPLSPALARWLMKLNHDAVHASDLALSRATDAEIIARAKEDARTIVTADLDYPPACAGSIVRAEFDPVPRRRLE